MLTAASLAELLKMTRDELKETCPWIPHRIIAVSRLLCHLKNTSSLAGWTNWLT